MPSIFTHYITGQQVIDKIKNPDVLELINNSRHLYNFGLQGPDFFKYYQAPFKADDAVTRISMLLHERTIDEWLSSVYRYIKAQAPEDAAILKPYFLGYLVHYKVDCAINPYVSYRVGFPTPGAEFPERFQIYRNRFNTAMDELILKKYLGKTPAEMDIKQIFWVEYPELLEITRLYPLHLKRILGREISREQAIKAAQNMYELTHKRIKPGITKLFVNFYENYSKNVYKGYYSSTIYGQIDPSIDYLNESKADWYLPWDNRVTRNESVPELLEKAVADAAALVEQIALGFMNQGSDLQNIAAMGNASMMTGVPWNAPFLPRHFDCVYKAAEERVAERIEKLAKKRLKEE